MSLLAFLFGAILQNKMAKTVRNNSPSSLSYGFSPINHPWLNAHTEGKPQPSNRHSSAKTQPIFFKSNREKAWSMRSQKMHTMSATAEWDQSYASLMLTSWFFMPWFSHRFFDAVYSHGSQAPQAPFSHPMAHISYIHSTISTANLTRTHWLCFHLYCIVSSCTRETEILDKVQVQLKTLDRSYVPIYGNILSSFTVLN